LATGRETNASVSGVFRQTVEYFKNLSGKTKKILIIAAVLVIAAGILLSFLAGRAGWSVLYYGLSSAEGGEVIARLDKMSVEYKTQNDGSILVPAEKVASLKMQLAAEGFPKSGFSYDLFLNQSDLFTTDYEKRQVLVFQLQERIQESIVTLQGVRGAIVTLNIPEDNSYVLKNEKLETTAAVLLDLYTPDALTKKQISGIELLVANSVPGLKSENVAIIDNYGKQLNVNTDNPLSGADLKIETISIINKVFEEKIVSFLEPVFGRGMLAVSVNVNVDFKEVITSETVYTPVIGDNGVISWVERTRDYTGDIQNGGDNDIPTYEESDSSGSGGVSSSASESYSAQYLVNQLIRQIQDSGGNITDITIAAVINAKELSTEDMAKYTNLIAHSAGVSPDKVALTNAEFYTPALPEPVITPEKKSFFDLINLSKQEVIIIAASLVFFILTLIFVICLISRKKRKKRFEEFEKIKRIEEESALSERANKKDLPGEIVLNETREQALKRQIKEFTSGNPETVAQLLRVWIKEEERK